MTCSQLELQQEGIFAEQGQILLTVCSLQVVRHLVSRVNMKHVGLRREGGNTEVYRLTDCCFRLTIGTLNHNRASGQWMGRVY